MRPRLFLALGAIQILVGAFVALRAPFPPHRPLTPSWVLDAAFAAYFLVRGVMNVRAARRTPLASPGARP